MRYYKSSHNYNTERLSQRADCCPGWGCSLYRGEDHYEDLKHLDSSGNRDPARKSQHDLGIPNRYPSGKFQVALIMKNDPKSIKGFTLIEILFALFIGLLLMSTIYVSMISGQRSSVALEGKVTAQQDARAILEIMALEIGMASFNPNFVTGIWRDGPAGTCGGVALNQTYKGIQEATTNSITVEMDINENSTLGNANETIRYVYDTANQRITRETNCGGGAQSFLGDLTGNPRSVQVVNNTAGIPLFRYFDGSGAQIASLPAGIPNIRRIEITLVVDTENVDPSTLQRRRMIYSTSVIPRNHAINL